MIQCFHMRKTQFSQDNYYHIYNRGVDKRSIFQSKEDLFRFMECIKQFNVVEPVGGIYKFSQIKDANRRSSTSPIVRFVAYCLNQNHYHFILEPLIENGIQKFMHKLSTGYTKYFNEKYERSGALFQGRYKSIHIETNTYLLHLSVYVNLNNKLHTGLNEEWLESLNFSSFSQYEGIRLSSGICEPSIILDQFNAREDYLRYAFTTLPDIVRRKEEDRQLKYLMLD